MNIIFLDIDGVLNCEQDFIDNYNFEVAYRMSKKDDPFFLMRLELNLEKILIIKYICDASNSFVVICSSWRNLMTYPLLEEYLTKMGIPVIGTTKNLGGRGEEIKEYLERHDVSKYVIIDDEIFKDYTADLLNHLVKPSFYEEGITYEHADEALSLLK